MSETTPRPDEPADDTTTTTPPPADTATEAATEPAASTDTEPTPEAATPPPPPPADEPAAPPMDEPAAPPMDEAPPPPAPAGATPPPPPPQAQSGYAPPQTYGAPQPPPGQAPMSPQDERTWSMATHGITLAALVLSGGTLGFVAALVLYLVYRDRGPYIRANTANALNIQITVGIAMLISFVLMFVIIGFFTAIAVAIFGLVMHIIGMVKANNGEWWDPPLTPTFVR